MKANSHSAAEAAVQVTRAAPLFDRLADNLVSQVDANLPSQGPGLPPERGSQLASLREQLDGFFPEFRQLYGGLLLKHIGEERAPVVLAALSDETIQVYFRALKAMEPELIGGLQRLHERMAFAAQSTLRS